MMTHSEGKLLTEHDTAAILNLSVKTLRRWRWAGRGPRFAKLGASVRYDPRDIEAYIEAARRQSTSDDGSRMKVPNGRSNGHR